MIWIAVFGCAGAVGFMVAVRKAPPYLRPAVRWIGVAILLIEVDGLLYEIAQGHDWTRIHRAVGAVGLLMSIAALSCVALGMLSWHRRKRAAADRAIAPQSI